MAPSEKTELDLSYPFTALLLTAYGGYPEGHTFAHAAYFQTHWWGPWVLVVREDGSDLSMPAGLVELAFRFFPHPGKNEGSVVPFSPEMMEG